jgi:2'-5' RNA ligase
MTSKTHKTAVVFIPPEECWEPIQVIRRQHDPHIRRWMPHVTLLYPFRPREQFDAVEQKLREVCRRLEPFEVRLAEFRRFHHGRQQYTLWLAPEPVDAMVRLQAALQSAVPDCDDVSRYGKGFAPHLSVGQVRGEEALTSLKASVQASWKVVSFHAEHVSLIRRDEPPDDVFRIDRLVGLGV